MTHSLKYQKVLQENAYKKISLAIHPGTMDEVMHDLQAHLDSAASAKFHAYYFSIIKNVNHFLATTNFFRKFNQHYSLRGMDNNFLDKLENNKTGLIEFIKKDQLVELYFSVFHKAKVIHKLTTVEMDLSSFFTKLVHTFRPSDYCAMDNLVKNYFGLKSEGFFMSFLVICDAYKQWTADNSKLIAGIKENFKSIDTKEIFVHDQITDLKLLDLIFWRKADTQERVRKTLMKRKKLEK